MRTSLKPSKIPPVLKFTLYHGASVLALATAITFLPPTDISFDKDADYGPNQVQKEFIRLNAKQFSYVAFGDTNHRQAEIHLFAMDKGTLEALHEGGVKNYFLEQPYQRQSEIDGISQNKLSNDFASAWNCNPESREKFNKTYNENIKATPEIKFIAADKRFEGDGYSGLAGAYRKAALRIPIGLYKKVYGCWSPNTFILPLLLNPNLMGNGLTDDTRTAELIDSYEGKGAILFGAAHFQARYEREKSMRILLTKNHKDIVVINIFKDAASEKESALNSKGMKPDAIFYINPPAENADGIEILNPALQKNYEQAKSLGHMKLSFR